jgi:glycosyltransferase involved in cell wall biosynthesis
MKLVIATPLYPPEIGGPATYAQLLFEGLPSKGITVELIKFSDVRHLPKIIRHYAYYRRVLAAARKADIVLALDPVSVGLPALRAAKKAGKPFVVKIVGDYAWEQGQQRFGIIQNLDDFVKTAKVPPRVKMFRKIQTRVATAAERVIVPSVYLKKVVVTWRVPPEKIEVIYNAIELPEIKPLEKRPPGFLIVSSGRRVPWKGFEALERVVAREARWRLFIASGLSRTETLQWVKSADVFVLNSSYEGLSHALIEAMVLGTPIVATDVGGNGELVENDVTGRLVPFGNDEALFAALKNIEQDVTVAHSRATVAQVRAKKFSVETMLTETAAALKKL